MYLFFTGILSNWEFIFFVSLSWVADSTNHSNNSTYLISNDGNRKHKADKDIILERNSDDSLISEINIDFEQNNYR